MSGSATEWLTVREQVDGRSRSNKLAIAFAAVVGPEDIVVDIGCGTGANIRYLTPLLANNQKWVGIDHDREMLRQAADRLPYVRVEFEELNLATGLSRVPTGAGFAVTASALLDIASERWLMEFASQFCNTPLLIAMTAAGQAEWNPVDELDEQIRSLLELHRRSDHGFGLALGSEAAKFLAEQLRIHGCQVTLQQSDWILGSKDHSLISMLIGGISRRVAAMSDSIDAQGWASLRQNQLQRDELRLVIKHVDLLSVPQRLCGTSSR